MKYELGSSFSYALIWMVFTMSVVFTTLTFVSDYQQVFNIKETVDLEFKRALNQGMIEYANDYYSSDYIAKLEQNDIHQLENSIRTDFKDKLLNDYNILLYIDSFKLEDTGKIVCKYKGHVIYRPMVFKKKVELRIDVKGRSKIQRIDGY